MSKQILDHLVKESIHAYFFNPKMKDSSVHSDLQELTQIVKKLSKKKRYVVFIVEDKVY